MESTIAVRDFIERAVGEAVERKYEEYLQERYFPGWHIEQTRNLIDEVLLQENP